LCDTQRFSQRSWGIKLVKTFGASLFDSPPNAWSGSATDLAPPKCCARGQMSPLAPS